MFPSCENKAIGGAQFRSPGDNDRQDRQVIFFISLCRHGHIGLAFQGSVFITFG
jgi:hypothetical protein